jgi:hypothetical protein
MAGLLAVLTAMAASERSTAPVAAAERFIALGDWGGAALGSYEKKTAYKVADAMDKYTRAHSVQWLINTGDNFYYCGLKNASDEQVAVDFDAPYGPVKGLDVPWYSTLGNHEYGWDVSAQIELTARSERWVLPARYYSKRLPLGGGAAHVSLLFLDTSPCVSEYRASDASKWDPCSTEYPSCAPIDGTAECRFHENILTQDCDAQFEWLAAALAAVPEDDWLVVAGHHPLDEVNVRDFASLLQARGFHLYLNGHVHALNQYTLDGKGLYITSGAGAMLKTKDQESESVQAKAAGLSFTTLSPHVPLAPVAGSQPSAAPPVAAGPAVHHTYETVWHQKVAGFTTHHFSPDYLKLTNHFVTFEGEIVHTVAVHKDRRVSAA